MRKALAPATSAAVASIAVGIAAGAITEGIASAAVGPDPALTKVRAKERRASLRRARNRHSHHTHAQAHAQAGGPSVASPALQRIAACESGGNPQAIGGGGTFRGKYQFTYATWAGVGGSGDPAAAPEAEQDRRAAMLLARSGPSQWPVCGR